MGMSEWGYSIVGGSPSESFTTSGAEASVTYIGPSISRMDFIKGVFGAWHIYQTNVGSVEVPRYVQCAQQYPIASPYADLPTIAANGACVGPYCLWPDTFSGKPADDSSIPNLWSDPDCTVTNDLLRPVVDTCAWEYTVNYRYRNHATLPQILKQHAEIGPNPPIPFGTFTDVRMTNSTEWMSIADRHWKYDANAYGLGSTDWDFCTECKNKPGATKIVNSNEDGGVTQATEINSVEIEVTWDNVPLPPWRIIRRANGCVNEHPIFGFPRGAVKFEFTEPELTGYFGCMEVYRLRYIFKVKTAQVLWFGSDLFDGKYNSGEVVDGMIGLWNRRFCSCPIKLAGSDALFTNWVPVRGITDDSTADCIGGGDKLVTRPCESFPLHLLFAMNVCDCSSGQITGGSCTETFRVLKVDRVNPDEGLVWFFDDMAEPTALAYAAAGIGTVV